MTLNTVFAKTVNKSKNISIKTHVFDFLVNTNVRALNLARVPGFFQLARKVSRLVFYTKMCETDGVILIVRFLSDLIYL